MQEIFERLSALCWLVAIFASAAMDSEAWIPVLAVIVLSSIGAYGFYRAAEWAYDYENSRNKSEERRKRNENRRAPGRGTY